MYALYITHPQIVIDRAVAVPRWHLSDLGRARLETVATRDWVRDLKRIVTSDETKAIETAEILAAGAGIRVEVEEGMGENDRSATGFLEPDAFEDAADWFFANPERSFHGWERAVDAQARIVASVMRILERHDRTKPIAFVGHGGVGTLLKCHLAGRPISRREDQPAGGGSLFAFALAGFTLSSEWTRIEDWRDRGC